uniref:Uncharacterized protein n=1 Tax=Rhizophora mucronata TaxID=61149 RepID=A0A2P2QA18_RHIMU
MGLLQIFKTFLHVITKICLLLDTPMSLSHLHTPLVSHKKQPRNIQPLSSFQLDGSS